jgi:hypothetical protein
VLLLSLLTLFAGPLLYQWIRNGGWLAKTLDRMAVIVLLLIVTLLLLPEIIAQLGFIALILALGGYLFPALLEVIVRRAAHTMHLATLLLALSGLVLHALLDGAGLAGSQSGPDQSLALAIILHRLGIGLMLWMIMQPAFGAKIAWATLAAVAAATIIGFEFSELIFPLAGDSAVMTIQAIIIGTIIHSLLHRGHMHGLSNASKQQ